MTEIDKREPVQSRKWAVITLHPWLPSRSEQIARARAWGLAESNLREQDLSAIIVDDVRMIERTTNWKPHLERRYRALNGWLKLPADAGEVFFATPLAVGFTEKLALETIEAIWEAGMQVYVHETCALYAKGDDIAELLATVASKANAAHVRATRRRKAGREIPEDADDPIPRGRRKKKR